MRPPASAVRRRRSPPETAAASPGPLVGSGRSADVFDVGDGKVLRRYRTPVDTEREAAAMEHARAHGFPAPAAQVLSDSEIVMDRVHGPTMISELVKEPWSLKRHAATLADLHKRLHAIRAPDWLPAPLGRGDSLLHLDLHPDNVLLAPEGPVVIDWPNAARGPGEAEVAHTWLVLACSLPPSGGIRRAAAVAGRRAFLGLFLRHFERRAVAPRLAAAAEFRRGRPTLPASELAAIDRLVERTRRA